MKPTRISYSWEFLEQTQHNRNILAVLNHILLNTDYVGFGQGTFQSSMPKIADSLEITVKAVRCALERLSSLNVIKTERGRCNGKNALNVTINNTIGCTAIFDVPLNIQGQMKLQRGSSEGRCGEDVTSCECENYEVLENDSGQMWGRCEEKQKENHPIIEYNNSTIHNTHKEKEKEEKKNINYPICNTKKKSSTSRFEPPTIEEVAEYINLKGYDIDAEQWWHFYNAKDWFIGRNKMKSWRSAVATWARIPRYNNNPNNNNYADGRKPYNPNEEKQRALEEFVFGKNRH